MSSTTDFPKSFGLLLYPGFEVLDIAGPIEALNCLARQPGFQDMKLSIISHDLELRTPAAANEQFLASQRWAPTHNLETAPQLDVLLVPGGMGAIPPLPASFQPYVDFVGKAYRGYDGYRPLKYIISVCNGTVLFAKAGILDGHKATTNKDGWSIITPLAPKTHWIARARWVGSGNIWTTSGVSAGTDGTLAWMSSLLPEELVTKIVNTMEWIRAESADNDPFAEVFGSKDVVPQ